MLHDAFYLITPKAEFCSHLADLVDSEFASLLLEPTLVQDKQPDRTGWKTEDYRLRVKLLFLVGLREYSPLAEDRDAQRILGSPDIDEQLFNRWWSITLIDRVETIETMKTSLSACKSQIDCSDNQLVADWLVESRQR